LVVDICRRLDGIPLALELAAANARAIALKDIRADLDDGFRLLGTESRGPVPRHRTIRAAVDWSHGLLGEPERTLFRRLAVFVGGFDLAAITAVCSDDDLPAADVPDLVQRLVDSSLVTVRLEQDGGLRYSLLQIFKRYVQERLANAGVHELSDLRARHAAHYAAIASRANTGQAHDAQSRLERVTADYDNLLLAMDWAASAEPAMESAFYHDLLRFWRLRGLQRESRERSRSVLATPGDQRAQR
jgi:predicted ATPase